MKSTDFQSRLTKWHSKNARALPWKLDKDPYKIWLSEILLQQTRVAQGLPYYQKFIKVFPDVKSLALASIDEILLLWQGLGYYSRAHNLHETAKYIHFQKNGEFPDSYEGLLQLKGVGPYTAAAIASFAFDLPYAVVDGNVVRVLARIFGFKTPFNSSKGKKQFEIQANDLISLKNPGAHNQAIMDFGAKTCTPQNPSCPDCPFADDCFAYNHDMVEALPVRSKPIIRKKRYFHYFFFKTTEGETLIGKRSSKDIWKGLYQFPNKEVEEKDFSRHVVLPDDLLATQFVLPHQPELKDIKRQLLTHQEIKLAFFVIEGLKREHLVANDFFLVDIENLCNFAFPKIIDWFIEEN